MNITPGDATPSLEDQRLTKRVKSAAEIIGFRFLDHVIVTDRRYYSFVENNREF